MRISLKKNIRKCVATAVAAVAVAAMAFTTFPCEAAVKKPTSMTVVASTKTVDIKGKSVITVKSVKPIGASKAVTFKSSNSKVAAVSTKGVVTGKKAGKVKITVTSKVNKKLKKTLKATVKPTGVYCPVKYTTSNKAVATVSTSGKITAKKPGTATITAKATQKSASGKYLKAACKVTVKIPAAVSERQVFVSPEWVRSAMAGQQKGYEKLFVSEVAYGKTEDDKAYNEAHIPGAYHINSDAVEYDDWDRDGVDDQKLYEETKVAPEDNFNIRNAKQLGKFLKNNGITKDTKVVLYGKNATDSSVTRVAFAMIYAGVEDVKVVDGGMEAWEKCKYPTERKVNVATAGKDDYAFGTTIPAHPEYILTADDVKEKLQNDANFRLVSIRSEKEFRGEETGYEYIDYAGEPLGAVWGHDTDDGSYAKNGKTAGLSTVKSYLAESDSSLDNELSFYCGTGWRATIPFLICYQNDVKNISVYDGGWWAWQLNWQDDEKEWPIQKVSPADAKTYGNLSFAKKEITTDSEGNLLIAKEASVKENPLTCWPERIRKYVEYGYGTELSSSIVTVDQEGKVTTLAFGVATVTAKTPASEAAYKINVQKGEDLYTSWTSMELEPEVVLNAVEDGDMDILDIRFASKVLSSGLDAGYAAGHIKGSIWAQAWPTTTATAQANVRKEAEKIKNSANPTTIVCMAGEEGARRAAAVLIDAGVPKSKLRILRGGGIELVKNYKDRLVTGTEE